MQFHPEKCRIPDEPNRPFISSEEIWDYINNTKSTPERVHEIIEKSLAKNRLTMEETAVLVNTTDPKLVEEIKEGARELKRRIYGNRIVLFAPLYVGNYCVNNCSYCGFRSSNKEQIRTPSPTKNSSATWRLWKTTDRNDSSWSTARARNIRQSISLTP